MMFDIDNHEYQIKYNDKIGRILISNRKKDVGEIIFQEKAFVCSNEEDDEIDIEFESIINAAFAKPVIKNLNNIIDSLSELDRIQSFDTAKNFIILLAIFILRKKDPSGQLLLNKCSQWNINQRDILQKINLFDQLTAHKLNECIEDAATIQTNFPQLIPFKLLNITIEEVGRLIGVLNTNQLETGADGSGLFVGTAILQHDCQPNASFNINDNILYLVAIRPISIGECLSIDYGNNFYHCTENRVKELYNTYGFICQCNMCIGHDIKRGFKCTQCQNGVIFPCGQGNTYQTKYNLICNQCGVLSTEAYLNQCYEREQFYLNYNDDIKSVKTKKNTKSIIDNNNNNILTIIQNEPFLHKTHYLIFWALDEYSLKMTENAQKELFVGQNNNAIEFYRIAQTALTEAIQLLEFQLPKVHGEKVIYYDRLAQLAIAVNDILLAKNLYKIAYENSCLANGNTSPSTLSIRELVDNTPTSLAELSKRYYK